MQDMIKTGASTRISERHSMLVQEGKEGLTIMSTHMPDSAPHISAIKLIPQLYALGFNPGVETTLDTGSMCGT